MTRLPPSPYAGAYAEKLMPQAWWGLPEFRIAIAKTRVILAYRYVKSLTGLAFQKARSIRATSRTRKDLPAIPGRRAIQTKRIVAAASLFRYLWRSPMAGIRIFPWSWRHRHGTFGRRRVQTGHHGLLRGTVWCRPRGSSRPSRRQAHFHDVIGLENCFLPWTLPCRNSRRSYSGPGRAF